jgi:hypothetical protein
MPPDVDKENEEFLKTSAACFQDLWNSKDFSDFTIIGGFDGFGGFDIQERYERSSNRKDDDQ